MNNNLVPYAGLPDALMHGGYDLPSGQPEDYIALAIGTTIRAVADVVKDANGKQLEADKEVISALSSADGESSSARGQAAGDYRKDAAKADADRIKEVGNTLLKVFAGGAIGGAVIVGTAKLLDDLL